MNHHRDRCRAAEQPTDHHRALSVGEHRHSAGVECRADVLGAVRRSPGQCREQITNDGILGAQGHPADADVEGGRAIGGPSADHGCQVCQRQTGGDTRPKGTDHRRSPPIRRLPIGSSPYRENAVDPVRWPQESTAARGRLKAGRCRVAATRQ